MLAREETMTSKFIEDDSDKIYPVVNSSGSDSAMLDDKGRRSVLLEFVEEGKEPFTKY